MFKSYNIFNYHKLDQRNNLKKKSNKNIILLPDYNTFLINNSIKTKKNHHLSRVLNDDLKKEKIIKKIINDLIDNIIVNDIINDVSDNLLDSVCIKNEVEIILNDLISDIEKDHEYINYMNSINEDDFDNCNNTGIPLKSFLSVGYYLFHNNE
jgi:hypothetical protein